MVLKRLLWLLPVLLLAAVTAQADTANVYVTGGYAFGNNGYGIGPYQGSLNGQSASFICVDFAHDIWGNTSWTATVTPGNTADFSQTRLGKDNGPLYLEMTWLATKLLSASNQKTQAELQWAIWAFTGGVLDPYGTNGDLQKDAAAAVLAGFNGDGWEILTPVDPRTGSTNVYGQEFLARTPEPGTLLLLGCGLVVLVGMATKKSIA